MLPSSNHLSETSRNFEALGPEQSVAPFVTTIRRKISFRLEAAQPIQTDLTWPSPPSTPQTTQYKAASPTQNEVQTWTILAGFMLEPHRARIVHRPCFHHPITIKTHLGILMKWAQNSPFHLLWPPSDVKFYSHPTQPGPALRAHPRQPSTAQPRQPSPWSHRGLFSGSSSSSIFNSRSRSRSRSRSSRL